MKKLRCIVVDDEPPAVEGLKDYIDDTDFLEFVGSARNAIQAAKLLKEVNPDLMFLDINMPKISGVEFLKELKNPPEVIFTTAHREFALDGFELDCVDYLLKPISLLRFLKAAEKAQLKLEKLSAGSTADDSFYIKENGIFVKIKYSDILCVEGVKDYIFIHTRQKRRMVYMTMKEAEEQLGERGFLRVHRSYIVNPDEVEAVEGWLLHIQDKKIPVSKSYRDVVKKVVMGDKLWKRE